LGLHFTHRDETKAEQAIKKAETKVAQAYVGQMKKNGFDKYAINVSDGDVVSEVSKLARNAKEKMGWTWNLIEAVHIHMKLPPEFPKKYKSAVIRAAELCTVKRNIIDPPKFFVTADIKE